MNAVGEIVPAPPVNIEAEQGILGALLINNDLLQAISFLRPEHFDEPLHRATFEALVRRISDGRPATAITLAADLPPIADPTFTAAAYLAHLAASAWTVNEQIAGTARELVMLGAKRRLLHLAAAINDMALGPTPVRDTIAEAETELLNLSGEVGRLTVTEPTPDAIMAEVEYRMQSGHPYKGARSGLTAIDNRLGGFAPGELIVVAGRPGMGKTALGLSLARRAAHIGTGVGFDSIEMTKTALWHRLLADECRGNAEITYKQIGRGGLTAVELDYVRRASERLKALPLVVLDRGNRLTDIPGHIRASKRWLAKRGKALELFVIDYLGLVQPGERYAGQKVNEVGEISSTLKALAKREGIAIIALHQLSRANESREERRPRLSDLRDSGNLEQDADVVIFVYRDAYYIERPGYKNFADEGARMEALDTSRNVMDVIVAKQRQGEIGTCRLWCDMATNSVRDET